jgi:hypothetical protein
MGWLTKKRDPISERAQALEDEINALEREIERLQQETTQPQPRFRSSARPGGTVMSAPAPVATAERDAFEEVEQTPVKSPDMPAPTAHYNELGVRKYDLAEAWQKLRAHFKGPATSNPKLVNYLAAGSLQGLRQMRYEKRVARNRFILSAVVLLLMLWGILAVVFRH